MQLASNWAKQLLVNRTTTRFHMGVRARLIVLSLTLALAGCGGEYEATMTGTVTYNGKPLPFALMSFHNQGQGPMAYSMTEEDGSYEVLTGSQSGLRPGKYKLAFESPPEIALPQKYSTIETSGLEFDVKAGKNTVNIKLD